MATRRSARVVAAAEQRACAFPQLPLSLALRIFSLLPADQRLRCAEVSRGWRATVALPALWRRLDLSPESGVPFRSVDGLAQLLHAAVARAGSALKGAQHAALILSTLDFEETRRAALSPLL